mmetsp:Transcript_17463/g.31508  ORF Transcript_17463/g.31508 Transcript_17463/m.31508 type:complete len:103 (+) Transcript_17463:58-366(+)
MPPSTQHPSTSAADRANHQSLNSKSSSEGYQGYGGCKDAHRQDELEFVSGGSRRGCNNCSDGMWLANFSRMGPTTQPECEDAGGSPVEIACTTSRRRIVLSL